MKNLLNEFKEFINRGNIIELAVAFILGLKIKDVVDSLVNAIVMPIVGAIAGKPSFDDLTLKIGKGVVSYGLFINAVLNFLIVAAAVFALVKVYEGLRGRVRKPGEEAAPEPDEKQLLTEIRDLLAERK